MTTHAPSPHSPVTARAAGRTTTRPPDSRPPAGPGRSRPSQPLPPRSWDPVRFRASDAVASRAAAHDLPRGEVNPIPGLAVKPLPDPSQWAAAVTQSAVEGLLGLRPVNQLSRWLAGPVYDQLTRRAGLALRVCGPSRSPGVRIRSVVVSPVDDVSREVSVTLHDGTRFRAAAMRLERYHGRWLVTALEIG